MIGVHTVVSINGSDVDLPADSSGHRGYENESPSPPPVKVLKFTKFVLG